MLGAVRRRWGMGNGLGAAVAVPEPAFTLAPYRVQRTPRERRRRTRRLATVVALVGAFYGFLLSFFPLAYYIYLSIPIVLALLFLVWALPETGSLPERTIEWLFFALFLGSFLWPNYLAIAIPGLPWITVVRLFAAPMCVLTLIGLSTSKRFRDDMWAPFRTSPWLVRLMIAFVIIQTATLPMSTDFRLSFNRYLNAQFQWTAVFFLSAYFFTKTRRALWWVWMYCGMAFVLCILGFQESRHEQVLWADSIPSFLAIEDPSVQAILAGGRREWVDIYRAQATFTTSLSFAEFLGMATSFFLYLILKARNPLIQGLLIAYIPASFWVIRATDSRLGVVAFFASFLLYFLLWALKKWMQQRRDLFAPLFVIAYPALASGFYILTLVWTRLSNMVWGGGAQSGSSEARTEQYELGIPKILAWPFGFGPAQAGGVLGYHNLAGKLTIDTYYLSIALDYGILGFLVYFGLIFCGVGNAVRYGLASRSEDADLLLPAAVMLTVFVIVKGVLAQEDTHGIVFMVLGMVAALCHRIAVREGGTIALSLRWSAVRAPALKSPA